MTPVFTARRQAEEFESGLSGALDLSDLSPRDAAALAPLLELVGELRAVTAPVPRADFVADLRARLMAEADTVLVPVDTATEARLRLAPADPRTRRRERRLGTLLGAAALVGATASVAVAAQGALPGQTLYPVKRAIENVRTDATLDDSAKATRLLASAAGRLAEVDQVARDGSPAGVAALPGTLDAFSSQTAQAGELLLTDYDRTGREGAITQLRDFAGTSMTSLARLEGTLPDSARDELLHAARLVAAYDDRAATACPSCAGTGITEVPSVLAASGTSAGVTVPASLPGIELPAPTDVPKDRRKGDRGTPDSRDPATDPAGDPAGDPSGDPPDDPARDPADTTGNVPVPDPPALPPTKTPAKDVGEATTSTVTDVIDTITGTLTGTGTVSSDPGVVGGVVDGVEDVVEGTGDVVDGTLGTVGGLTGGLLDGLTDP